MKKSNRRFRPPTPESLANAALAYLSRFAASEAALRRVLENRLRRAALHHPAFAQDEVTQEKLRQSIAAIVEKYRKNGILNDASYAEIKIRSLRRAGRSARAIRQKLAHAGVDKTIVARVLTENDATDDEENAELKAARELARRKRLGAFRAGINDRDKYRKDLATLARAGFALDIARRALVKDEET